MADRQDEDLHREIINKLDSTLDRLHSVWDVLGLDVAQRATRIEVVTLHLNNLLDEIVREEENLCERILANIKAYSGDVTRLGQVLGLLHYKAPDDMTNVQLEKYLKKKRHSLEEELNDRTTVQRKLDKEERQLCDTLSEVMARDAAEGTVPTWCQLEATRCRIGEMKREIVQRQVVVQSTKSDIRDLLKELQISPRSSFQRQAVCNAGDSFNPTAENMTALKQYHDQLETQRRSHLSLVLRLRGQMEVLWKRLCLPEQETRPISTRTAGCEVRVLDDIKTEIARCDLLMSEKMRECITNVRLELIELWDNCYVEQEERAEFQSFASPYFNEISLKAHEDEVTRMAAYYNENSELLNLVEKWKKLFEQYLEHERRASDPTRYSNRGCYLLKEEKARKRVEKDLPVVERDVCKKIVHWERCNDRIFKISGTPFVEFMAQCWEGQRQEKLKAKKQRIQAKRTLMNSEAKYINESVTSPDKRRRLNNCALIRKPSLKRGWHEKESVPSMGNNTISSVNSSAMSPARNSHRPKPRTLATTPKRGSR
ncbi:hypothetical protein LSH36_901g01021 [Paralvinella palmiformis]|uniref:Protein regulator of cytokinesis 1 n=1 Tax=Paralvinella palmiformis TaxID=53620 RepID=A0AAD9IYF9_9ANNE|nr:hypothetical protein LSH36_901g01021 [Paralvinella palmiformis]